MTDKTPIWTIVAVGIVVAIFGGVWLGSSSFFGASPSATLTRQANAWQWTGTNAKVTIGTNGTAIAGVKFGSCTIWAPAQTITATSTQQAVCQSATDGTLTSGLTGVTTDAVCFVRNASSTNSTLGGLVIGGTSASSTAGSIVVQLANFTGTTFTWTAAASSSAQWNYLCYDPA